MKDKSSQQGMGVYSKKFMATRDAKNLAEMKLVTFAAVHNISFANFRCLVKTIQEAFPDSEIAKRIKMGKDSASYHLRFGLSKTEDELLKSELSR